MAIAVIISGTAEKSVTVPAIFSEFTIMHICIIASRAILAYPFRVSMFRFRASKGIARIIVTMCVLSKGTNQCIPITVFSMRMYLQRTGKHYSLRSCAEARGDFMRMFFKETIFRITTAVRIPVDMLH